MIKRSKKRLENIVETLKKEYPEAKCSLDFETPFQMAVAVLLSAQATDARVNIITPALFLIAPNAEKMALLSVEEIKEYIKSINYYNNKSKNIHKMANQIVREYNGVLPNNMEDLQKLAGIGRKSANVIMLEAFNNPQGIAVDTHAKRVSNRLGLSDNSDPDKIEKDLLKQFDKKHYKDINHLFVWHGRYTCTARNPKCEKCNLKEECIYYKDNK